MPYVLLAIGALMSVVGLYSIVTGYRIVQVEEGWSSVIAGSVLFVGGFVTIGLGLILRSLRDLRRALPGASALGVASVSAGSVAAVAAPTAPPIPPAPEVAQIDPHTEPVPAAPPNPAAPFAAPLHASAPASAEPEPALPEPPRFEAFELPPAPQTSAYELPRSPEPEVVPPAAPHPSDDYKLETPSTPEHDLAPVTREETSPPSLPKDDWLDRAFAELDKDLSKTERTVPPRLPPAPPMRETNAPPVPEPAYATAEPDPIIHDAAAAESAPAAQPPSPAPSAIIGRYEADGTTYVMFADGSIEAQSPNGVYRFASMAELKSFIER